MATEGDGPLGNEKATDDTGRITEGLTPNAPDFGGGFQR